MGTRQRIFLRLLCILLCSTWLARAGRGDELLTARDRQDSAAIQNLIGQYERAANQDPKSADAQYRLALAYSYGAEVAMEMRDKKKAESLAEAGLAAAQCDLPTKLGLP